MNKHRGLVEVGVWKYSKDDLIKRLVKDPHEKGVLKRKYDDLPEYCIDENGDVEYSANKFKTIDDVIHDEYYLFDAITLGSVLIIDDIFYLFECVDLKEYFDKLNKFSRPDDYGVEDIFLVFQVNYYSSNGEFGMEYDSDFYFVGHLDHEMKLIENFIDEK